MNVVGSGHGLIRDFLQRGKQRDTWGRVGEVCVHAEMQTEDLSSERMLDNWASLLGIRILFSVWDGVMMTISLWPADWNCFFSLLLIGYCFRRAFILAYQLLKTLHTSVWFHAFDNANSAEEFVFSSSVRYSALRFWRWYITFGMIYFMEFLQPFEFKIIHN